MSSGVDAFLFEKNRIQKRNIQEQYFTTAIKYLNKPINILDLPSINVLSSIKRFSYCGALINRYEIFEQETEILKEIRKETKLVKNTKVSIHKGEVLSILTGYRSKALLCKEGIDLFHFDFCDALSPNYRSFLLADAVKRHMNSKAAVIVTFSTRKKGNINRLNLAMNEYLALDDIQVLHQESKVYYDTCTMRSNLYLLKENKCHDKLS